MSHENLLLFYGNNWRPPWGTNSTLPTKESLKMVYTRSKVGVSKQAEILSKDVTVKHVDLAAILEGQAKMQQKNVVCLKPLLKSLICS